MEKTLTITGKGNLFVSPTITKIILSFNETLQTYKEAMDKSVKDEKEVKDILVNLGFTSAVVKNLKYNIKTKYETEYLEHGNRKEKFIGYEYNQTLSVKFKNNNKLLSKILQKLSSCVCNPKITIGYEIENKEEAEHELLVNCVKDALDKAKIISMSAGVELVGISKINFIKTPINYNIDIYEDCCAMPYKSAKMIDDDYEVDFNPEDLNLEEAINIEWAIK